MCGHYLCEGQLRWDSMGIVRDYSRDCGDALQVNGQCDAVSVGSFDDV